MPEQKMSVLMIIIAIVFVVRFISNLFSGGDKCIFNENTNDILIFTLNPLGVYIASEHIVHCNSKRKPRL